ncbi:hypothetical protein DMR34_10960 [Klebsiella variicola]|uniref:hypothetical protein n=1 Tax=Klebsiella variicola TaxID=244366 RepID=UPI000D742B83|nr:hypothetical protein [Klebsiella variicola]PXK07026.1 hypothetical protein DMR34_10960 [Klebsiella variicola]
MKERGMIFNAEMVRAILDGRKTQTRRTVKPQPDEDGLAKVTNGPWVDTSERSYRCPFGSIGDRIWVRETWAEAGASAPDLKLYRANYPEHVPSIYENVPPTEEIRWTPSIHMPRWASRILLEITDVRVEQLNAISQEDAQAEGMELTGWRPTYSDPDSGGEVMTPYDNFAELWSSIYGEESWKANSWVWVISFKRIEGGAV